MKKVIIIGCGGHSKVIIDIILKKKLILKEKIEIIGILDDSYSKNTEKKIFGISVIGKIERINKLSKDIYYIIGIGNNNIRKKIFEKYSDRNYITLIHPNSIIGTNVEVDDGTVVMGGAIINSDSRIGKHCIINTGSIVEHDNRIADYVHISPSVTLCGGVTIGELSWIGAKSVIIQGIIIEKNVMVGAGSVVIKNITDGSIIMGVPAKLKNIKEN